MLDTSNYCKRDDEKHGVGRNVNCGICTRFNMELFFVSYQEFKMIITDKTETYMTLEVKFILHNCHLPLLFQPVGDS